MSRKKSLFAVLVAAVLVLSVVGPVAAGGVTTTQLYNHPDGGPDETPDDGSDGDQPNDGSDGDHPNDPDDGDSSTSVNDMEEFGQEVSDQVQWYLDSNRRDNDGNNGIGGLISEWVTSHNPGGGDAGPPSWVFGDGDRPGPDNGGVGNAPDHPND